jgi:hypothetical protein
MRIRQEIFPNATAKLKEVQANATSCDTICTTFNFAPMLLSFPTHHPVVVERLRNIFLFFITFLPILSMAQQPNINNPSNPNFQAQPPLSAKAKEQIEHNIANSTDWDRLNVLKSMAYNFPQMAPSLNAQIEAIYQTYRFTYRPSMQEMREQEQWQIQQQNQKLLQQFNNAPKPTKEDIAELQQNQQQGKAPNPNQQQQMRKEMSELLEEVRKNNQLAQDKDYYQSAEYIQDVPNYTNAKDLIKSMLDGKIPLSIKDAYYYEEASYGKLHLSYEEYNKVINDNVAFIKQWLKENKYDINNSEALHLGIQRFMGDTLYITTNTGKQGHLPYYYDYIDALAKNDKRNYFVTKTLATGGGQCNSLPIVYMILAEALGVEFNLAYNPQHSFIRYPNDDGTIVNYETTVARVMPDQFFMGIVSTIAKAKQNKIFLNSLGKRKIIAALLFDVAQDFLEEHWLADKSFIKECMSIATPYFPNEEYICIANYNLRKTLYADEFNTLVKIKGIQNMSDIEKYPDVLQAYKNYYGYMDTINALGIQDIPENVYLQMLEHYDVKGKLQVAKNPNFKSKQSLFIK